MKLVYALFLVLLVSGCNYFPEPKEPETIKELPCLITVEGTVMDAIEAFEDACGVSAYRSCITVSDGISQCDNQPKVNTTSDISTGFEQIVDVLEVMVEPVEQTHEIEEVPYFDPTDTSLEYNQPPEETDEGTIALEKEVSYIDTEVSNPDPVLPVKRVVKASQVIFEKESEPEPKSCATDDFSDEEAKQLFANACASNGFPYVGCNTETGVWTCTADIKEAVAAKAKPEPVKKKVVKKKVVKKKVVKRVPRPTYKKPDVENYRNRATDLINEKRKQPFIADSDEVSENNTVEIGDVWANAIYNENQSVWVAGFNDNVLGVVEYINLAYKEVDTKQINIVAVNSQSLAMRETARYAHFVNVYSEDDIDVAIDENTRP